MSNNGWHQTIVLGIVERVNDKKFRENSSASIEVMLTVPKKWQDRHTGQMQVKNEVFYAHIWEPLANWCLPWLARGIWVMVVSSAYAEATLSNHSTPTSSLHVNVHTLRMADAKEELNHKES